MFTILLFQLENSQFFLLCILKPLLTVLASFSLKSMTAIAMAKVIQQVTVEVRMRTDSGPVWMA
jgi:hypothetical protein